MHENVFSIAHWEGCEHMKPKHRGLEASSSPVMTEDERQQCTELMDEVHCTRGERG